MNRYLPIRRLHAREVLDSRGNPTVEVEVTVGEGVIGLEGYTGRAIVPSGASTGKFEAVELRDKEEHRYNGLGVKHAVEYVNTKLADELVGENCLEQKRIDKILCETDGTENKSNLGANAILGVSLAAARAAAMAMRMSLYQYLGGCCAHRLPVPMMNVLNGGKHAENTIDFQEFMIMPVGMTSVSEGIRICTEIYHTLKVILKENNLSTGIGDEGGFAPDLAETRNVFELLKEAVIKAGYNPGTEIVFAMDAAASELYDQEKGVYFFPGESKMKGKQVYRDSKEMIDYYEMLIDEFPIISIEDGLQEDDWDGWKMLTKRLGDRIQLVGDDLFVTNKVRVAKGIMENAANAVLVKVNQIGTLSEAMDTIELAHKSGYKTIISHRSGETEDTFIADLAVAVGSGQIKTGAPCRSERTGKYNQLLRIEEALDGFGVYENPFGKS